VTRRMRIATWNLERPTPAQGRVAQMREHMHAVSASLWILTETHKAVGPSGDYHCVFSGEPDRSSQPGERWIGLWSVSALTSLSSYVSDPSRCAAAHVPGSELGELIVYGCVLPWSTPWRGIPAENGQAFDAALSAMVSDWHRLRTAFPEAHLVVAGDFNQSLAAHHYYGSKRKRFLLETALAETGLRVPTSGPGDPIARDSAPYACIDHICISDDCGWRAVATSRWPETSAPVRRLSDHFGVAVDLVSP
jgi:hypothetical protein